ncbi:MAG: tetratricopeptide repeat protein [Aestuariibaculum sp.]
MKHFFTIFFIGISTLCWSQSKVQYQNIIDSLNTIDKAEVLVPYFENELKKYPKSDVVLQALGYVHLINNNFDLGEEYTEEALAINPKCGSCYLLLGKISSTKGDNKKALTLFNKAIEIAPKEAEFYADRAKLYNMMGDNFNALRDHNKTIKLNPDNYYAYIQRGKFNALSGHNQLALNDFSKAVDLASDKYLPYFERATFYFNIKNTSEALNDIKKAIACNSNEASLYALRGTVYSVMGNYQKAIPDFSKAILLDKNNTVAYLNRAKSYYQLENMDAACTDYQTLKVIVESEKAIDILLKKEVNDAINDICDTSKPSYYYQRGIAQYNLKNYNEALRIYEEGLSVFPNHSMILSFIGNAYMALNKYGNAVAAYRSSLQYKSKLSNELKKNPRLSNASNNELSEIYKGNIASIYYNLAKCELHLGKTDSALINIDLAIEQAPDITDIKKETYYNLRGLIYLVRQDYKQALTNFDTSISINDTFPEAYANRAIAKISLPGKKRQAATLVGVRFNTVPITFNFNLPRLVGKKQDNNIQEALLDCDTAITLDSRFGYAYYIRGQIKKIVLQTDYCSDILLSEKWGYSVEEELLKNCKKNKAR